MRNIISFFVFIFISIVLSSVVHAYEMVSPKKGEGPVQIAERIGVSPGKFIALNLKLGNFKYPKRVSLIYTWQKFAVPAKHAKSYPATKVYEAREAKKKIEKTLQIAVRQEENRITEIESRINKLYQEFEKSISRILTPFYKQDPSVKEKRFFSMNGYQLILLLAVSMVISLGLMWWNQERLRKKILMGDDMYLFGLFPSRKSSSKWQRKHKREQDPIYVVCCLETGNFVVITGNSHYRTQHSGEKGLMGIRDFIKKVHEKEELNFLRFEVPQPYEDTCRPLTEKEKKIFQDFTYKK